MAGVEAAGLPSPMRVEAAPRPLSIAIVYSRLPVPMTRADQMTVAHLIEFLAARGHRVDLFGLDIGEAASARQRAWLRDRCRNVHAFPQGRWRSLTGLLRGVFRRWPLQVGWFHNRRQIATLRRALSSGAYDIGYAYYIRSAEALRGLGRGASGRERPATFLAMQLSQALNTRRMMESFTSWRNRIVFGVESRLLRPYEARVWADFDRTVLIGEKDVAEIRAICREEGVAEIDNFVLGPHGVDTERFAPGADEICENDLLVFSGVMRTNTNIDAISWFVEAVWPRIRAERPGARLLIVGRQPAPSVRALGGRDGIEVTGEVADPAAHIARATVCINPIRAGAGMQNKLIEFMAMAKPVVATSVANEGIGAPPGEALVIADGAQAFGDAVLALLDDPARRAALGAAARRHIEAHWTWEAHFLKLEAEMFAALDSEA